MNIKDINPEMKKYIIISIICVIVMILGVKIYQTSYTIHNLKEEINELNNNLDTIKINERGDSIAVDSIKLYNKK